MNKYERMDLDAVKFLRKGDIRTISVGDLVSFGHNVSRRQQLDFATWLTQVIVWSEDSPKNIQLDTLLKNLKGKIEELSGRKFETEVQIVTLAERENRR